MKNIILKIFVLSIIFSLSFSAVDASLFSDIGDFFSSLVTGQTTKAKCGNAIKEKGEVCDTDDFGEVTCKSLGYTGGTLLCSADCNSLITKKCLAKEEKPSEISITEPAASTTPDTTTTTPQEISTEFDIDESSMTSVGVSGDSQQGSFDLGGNETITIPQLIVNTAQVNNNLDVYGNLMVNGRIGIGKNAENNRKLDIKTISTTTGATGIYNFLHYDGSSGTGTASFYYVNTGGAVTGATTVKAIEAYMRKGSAGELGNMYGISSNVALQNNYISVGEIRAFSAGHISTTGSPSVTDYYGLYLEQQDDVPIANDYGVYVKGERRTNYFEGDVGIGTNDPSAKLDVRGDIGVEKIISNREDGDVIIKLGTGEGVVQPGGPE